MPGHRPTAGAHDEPAARQHDGRPTTDLDAVRAVALDYIEGW